MASISVIGNAKEKTKVLDFSYRDSPVNPGRTRLQQMDGLRGIAMLFVFMGHFGAVWSDLVHPKGTAGLFLRIVEADATFGSSFFMLLSAFFTYGSLRRGSKSFGAFLRGRFWRIYPLYLVMTAVYVVASILVPKMSKLPADHRQIPIFILETLLFLPGLLPIRPLMDVAWTLSFVILFYFIEGGLAALFRVWRVSRILRFALFCCAAILWAVIGDHTQWWEPRTTMFWVGMALSETVEGMSGVRRGRAVQLVLPAALIVVLGVWLRTHLMLNQPETPVVSLLVWRAAITSCTLSAFLWACYFGPQWWKRLLSASQLRQLGVTSYSFYLTHGVAIKIFRYWVIPRLGAAAGTAPVFWASQVVGLALSIWIARMVYKLIENPLSELVPKSFPQTAAQRLPLAS